MSNHCKHCGSEELRVKTMKEESERWGFSVRECQGCGMRIVRKSTIGKQVTKERALERFDEINQGINQSLELILSLTGFESRESEEFQSLYRKY